MKKDILEEVVLVWMVDGVSQKALNPGRNGKLQGSTFFHVTHHQMTKICPGYYG